MELAKLNHHPVIIHMNRALGQRRWVALVWRYKMVLLLPIFVASLFLMFRGEIDLTTLRFNKTFLAIAVAEMGLLYGVWSSRWRLLINNIVGRSVVSRVQLYFYLVTTHILGQFVPHTASIATVGSATLNRVHQVPLAQGATSVLFDQLFHALLVALLMFPALLTGMGVITVETAVVLSMFSLGLMWIGIATRYGHWLKAMQHFGTWILAVGSRLPLVKKYVSDEKMGQIQNLNQSGVLSKSVVLQAYSLSVIGFLAMVLRSWLIGQVIGVEVGLEIIFVGVALVQAGSLVGFTPGGLGIKEGAWVIALSSADLGSEQLALFLIAHRLIPLLALVVVWVISYVVMFVDGQYQRLRGK